MTAIGFNVEQIVGDVGGRGAETKTDKGDGRIAEHAGAENVREQHGQKDQHILRPLMQPNRFQRSLCGRDAIPEFPADGHAARAQTSAQRRGRISDHRCSRMLQQGKVGPGVADVVVARIAESFAEAVELVAGGQIRFSVAGEHAVEQAQVVGNAGSQLLIRAGRQIQLATLPTLDFEVFDDGAVVRQMAYVEGDASADFGFEGGFAAEDPERKLQRRQGAAAHQKQQRVHQGVTFDQGAIQIDAERPPRDFRRHLLQGCLGQRNLSHGSEGKTE